MRYRVTLNPQELDEDGNAIEQMDTFISDVDAETIEDAIDGGMQMFLAAMRSKGYEII